MARIHVLRQQEADLKAEGRAILDKAASDGNRALTAEEADRFTAIEASLDALKPEIARELRFQDAERASGSRIQMGVDHATERPWGTMPAETAPPAEQAQARQAILGAFGIAVMNAAKGIVDPRLYAAATGMGSSIPSDGGFAVPQEVAPGIEREMFAVGQLLSRVDARTISGDAIAYTVLDETARTDSYRQGGVLGYWVDQGTAPTASQFKLARLELKLRKVGALGYMTDELMSDAIGLGGELERMFSDELVFQVENAIYRGTGSGQPLGFLSAPCLVSVAKETNQPADTINTTNLSKMWARLPAASQANAVWLVNVDCQPQLDELSQAIGTAGTAPRFVNYGPTGALTIKGRPVVAVEYAATIGDLGDISLVDLKQYRFIRKGGVEQASSIHVKFSQGETTFRAFYRCDGQAVPRAAITPYKGSATLSPFIVLAAR